MSHLSTDLKEMLILPGFPFEDEKACFRETGRRYQYYKDTHEDAIIMSLEHVPELSGRLAGNGKDTPFSKEIRR